MDRSLYCPLCGLKQPADHRFCLSCGTPLPGHLLARPGPKVSRWFWGVPVSAQDHPHSALRVTRYLEDYEVETEDGTVRIPSHHVRFSVWHDDHAVCAISLPDDEAAAVARFILTAVPHERGPMTVSTEGSAGRADAEGPSG